jgi:hypothetical protein
MEHQTTTTEIAPIAPAGAAVRKDFGGTTIARDSVATQAIVAQARAAIEARYTMALHRPRNYDTVRVLLLKECRRPGFAEVARYHKPVGDGVEGPSIRFAEAAARCMGNIYTEEYVIYEDEDRIVMRVSATDLESNLTFPKDVRISKVIERRQVKRGDRVVGERTNSRGQTVYLIATQSEDDLANKVGAACSKALRVCLLRVIPGDLVDEGQRVCMQIVKDRDAKDPGEARKVICDAFAEQGVLPDELVKWLGHPLEVTSPAELGDLRKAYAALRDGEASWPQILEHRLEQLAAERKPATAAPAASAPPASPPPGVPSTAPAPAPAQAAPAAPQQPATPPKRGGTASAKAALQRQQAEQAPSQPGPAPAREPQPDDLPAWAGGVDPDGE